MSSIPIVLYWMYRVKSTGEVVSELLPESSLVEEIFEKHCGPWIRDIDTGGFTKHKAWKQF